VPTYVVLGLNEEERKEVLSITIGESESAQLQRSFQPILAERAERA
jgi:transposase-like protein